MTTTAKKDIHGRPQTPGVASVSSLLTEQEIEDRSRELRFKVLQAREHREDTQAQLEQLLLRRDVLLDALGPDVAAEVRSELGQALEAEGLEAHPQLTNTQLQRVAPIAAHQHHHHHHVQKEQSDNGSSIAQWMERCE